MKDGTRSPVFSAETGNAVLTSGRPKRRHPRAAPWTDADVLSAYRATGEGWQGRINADPAEGAEAGVTESKGRQEGRPFLLANRSGD
ncbi:BrnA antitoxin family protein [Nitrobacter sp.]|uniref:BrnA antitoxin family protein n=1 Tax=Nitrobacter sp. TaxID=29420 RepID=UPI00399D696E